LKLSAINSSDRIYLFGANAQGPYWMLSNQGFTTQIYDPTSGNWTVGTSMPTGRFDPGVAAIKDKLYVIGGYSYGTLSDKGFTLNRPIIFSTTNEQYTPALDDTTQTSPQPSNSPISPPTPQSIIKDPESIQHPATSLPAKETQQDAVHFPTVPVAVISIIMIAVTAGLLIYSKERKLRLDELVKKP